MSENLAFIAGAALASAYWAMFTLDPHTGVGMFAVISSIAIAAMIAAYLFGKENGE